MKARVLSVFVLAFSIHSLSAEDAAKVISTSRYTDAKTGLTMAGVEIDIPADVEWKLEPLPAGSGVRQEVMSWTMAGPDHLSRDGKKPAPWRRCEVIGLVSGKAAPVTLKFSSYTGGRTCSVQWNPAEGASKAALLGDWATQRAANWATFAMPPNGSLTRRWMQSTAPVYDGTNINPRESFLFSTENPEAMETLAVFGGRCAIAETLQMRDIDSAGGPQAGRLPPKRPDQMVPVSSLAGVNVKSHPFAEMAKGANPPALPLANLCPADRFFAYFPQPRRIRTVIERLGEASLQLSSPSVDGAPDYRLWEKYLARLGLDEKTVQAWIDAGRAESVAFTLPDLFIRDATDITFLIQMKEGDGPALFKLMPEANAVLTLPGNGGGQCHMARRGNVLIASTSKIEAELCVKLADAGGKGSLGASDELRCMRQKLPESGATVAWCYFSDPFIRRLTGPAVKIGQHRRLQARENMEALTAAALLYQLDHGAPAPDKETLIRTGYAHAVKPETNRGRPARPDTDPVERRAVTAAAARFKEISLAPGPLATSAAWGTLTNLKTLGELPVTEVTPDEAEKYKTYVTRYSDYWRRYFDPIAIRLDEPVPGTWSLSTFILPLVDNSLYSGLKANLDTLRAAAVPQLQPQPPAVAALVMNPAALARIAGDLPLPAGGTGLTGRIALAFPDADPVFQVGGLAGMQQLGAVFGRNGMDDVASIGLLVMALTRPLDLFLEIEQEDRAAALLDVSAGQWRMPWLNIRRVTREEDTRRIYVLDLEGIAQIHMDAKVENGWLHISNHPWSGRLTATGTMGPIYGGHKTGRIVGNAVVLLNPAAFQTSLPAALFQAQNARRSAVLSACSELLPWMETLGLDSTAARERQYASLGLSTPLPDDIRFTAARPLTVPSLFTEDGEILTAAAAKSDPGILAGIRSVNLRTSFEEDGLRAELEWVTTAP